MKCPACKGELRKRNAGNMELDVCLGGCGGIWFDQGELFRLPDGGLLIDTAGLREFQPWDAASDLDAVFPEVAELAAKCRFRDCRHEGEPGCAVQLALGDGGLDARRFEHYLRLKREQAYQAQKRNLGAQLAEKTRWKQIAQWQKEFMRHREK